MAFESGAVATLTLNGVDISPYIEGAKLTSKGKDDRHRLLGSNGIAVLVQDPEQTIDVDGLIDPIVTAVFTPLIGSGVAAVAFTFQPQGPTGTLSRTGNCKVVDYDEDTTGEKAGMFKATLAVDGLVTYT